MATLEVTNLAPAPGSALTTSSVLTADVAYIIEGFQPGVDYYLAPLFASREGEGTTFNETDRLSDSPRLTAATGRLAVRYSLRKELESDELAVPVRIWLYVMERTGGRSSRVIGRAGPYEYGAAR